SLSITQYSNDSAALVQKALSSHLLCRNRPHPCYRLKQVLLASRQLLTKKTSATLMLELIDLPVSIHEIGIGLQLFYPFQTVNRLSIVLSKRLIQMLICARPSPHASE